jgi:L-alanine-DL-glutamate epimerase-like enolase superfamily enzyme
LHYGGRGGPPVLALSALDIALWDLKARRANVPLFRLLGGFDARVPCYAGGIDLDLSVEALLQQTDDNLAKGYRAIKMKVGRPDLASDVTRVKTMRKHLGNGFSHGGCQHEMDGRGSHSLRACTAALRLNLA